MSGNLLIRRAPPNSRSPYNFEIVLLDHGLYFDLDPQLRINYSKFWLSLIEKASPETRAARRKYAELVGNITPDLVRKVNAAGRLEADETPVSCIRGCDYRPRSVRRNVGGRRLF